LSGKLIDSKKKTSASKETQRLECQTIINTDTHYLPA